MRRVKQVENQVKQISKRFCRLKDIKEIEFAETRLRNEH